MRVELLEHKIGDSNGENSVYTFCIHCPLFVKHQLDTHRHGFVEVSSQCMESTLEFYTPRKWRLQSAEKEQSSEGILDPAHQLLCHLDYEHVIDMCKGYYDFFKSRGVAHEQARLLLPVSLYTTFWWTGSLESYQRVFDLRTAPDTHAETRMLVNMMYVALHERVDNGKRTGSYTGDY